MRASGGLRGSFACRPMTTSGKGASYLVDIDPDHSFGMALRPPTPIKAVIGNYYGEVAGYQNREKTQNLRDFDENVRIAMNNPPKSHTRASAMANSFVAGKEQKKVQAIQPKSLFKMQKFLATKPRTDTTNKSYKPAHHWNRTTSAQPKQRLSTAAK